MLLGIVRISMGGSPVQAEYGKVGYGWKKLETLQFPFQFGRGLLHVKLGIYCERYLDLGDICANGGHRGAPSCICEYQDGDADHFRQDVEMDLSSIVMATVSWCILRTGGRLRDCCRCRARSSRTKTP